MKRWVVAVGTGAIVAIAGLPALASGDSADDTSTSRHHDVDDAAMLPGLTETHPDKTTGHGPPRWARRHGARPGGQHGGWKELSPRRRAALMAELARQHTDGMASWTACVAAGRDGCVRPLPPGLAKRR